jgi:type III pantothenate kinase
MSCVVVDIGNTRSTIGLARQGRISRVSSLSGGVLDPGLIERSVKHTTRGRDVSGAVIGSVVPKSTRAWISVLKRITGSPPVEVTHRLKLDVGIQYPKPQSIGADRIANACGARVRYGAPVIVADFGTGLTFDIVSCDGNYIGGVIAPGLPLMTDYLADRTALLPHIRLTGSCGIVGKSTEGAMRIGARVGYRGIVREIVTHLSQSPDLKGAALCATGGYARWALSGLDMPFHYDPHITLFGLSRIFDLNHGG